MSSIMDDCWYCGYMFFTWDEEQDARVCDHCKNRQ